MSTIKKTFCRICGPGCPINATLDEQGKITQLEPNKDHPMGGTPCNVGLSFLDIHYSPDRLNWPLKRQNPKTEKQGQFERQSWDDAWAEIGERLRKLRDKYGKDAVALYSGNPFFFDSRAYMTYAQMIAAFGSRMLFSAATQDVSNKLRGATDIYGTAIITVPDLYNAEYLLCVGANPKVSHWSGPANPNDPLQVLKDMKARGGKTVFVNPRKIESSTPETGETLFIKPGADVYLLAAVLNEIVQCGGVKKDLLERYGKNTRQMLDFAAQYPVENVVEVTGISADDIRQIATDIMAANGASVFVSTGINQSRQGMLTYWLGDMINFATGNLGSKGGSFIPSGYFNIKTPQSFEEAGTFTTSVGELNVPSGAMPLPAVVLPDLIESGEIKALVVVSGNPLLSIAGEERMREAFSKLDTLVSIDIMRNATAEMADYVLPATDWLEREDINWWQNGMQIKEPFVQHTDAIEAPAEERREDWWIISRLAQELEVPSLLDDPEAAQEGFATINGMLAMAGLSVDKIKAAPNHVVPLEAEPQEVFFERCLVHPDNKIDCYPAPWTEGSLFERCAKIYDELKNEPEDSLRLISMRTIYMHNSWMANTPTLRKGVQSYNPLHMCSEDAQKRGLHDGETISVYNEYGRIDAILRVDDNMSRGVVAMTHGYGHRDAYSMKIASDRAGVNCNHLMPTTLDSVEPLSYMSWMNGVPVSVEKISVQEAG